MKPSSSPAPLDPVLLPSKEKIFQREKIFRTNGDGKEELSPPSGFAFTPDGNLVVADDFNHRIQIYDSKQNPIKSFGGKGKNPGQFHYPRGIAVDAQGNIYVADSWNHRVQKFDGGGNHLLTIGSCGEGKGQLNEPYDVLTDPDGNILIVERYNHRIQIFDAAGNSQGWIGDRGSVLEEHLACIHETPHHLFAPPVFEFPTSIARDSFGNYFVSDSGNHRIVKFDCQWRHILSFGERGSGTGQFEYPLCVAAGPNNLLYVADLNNNRIQVFTGTGQFITQIHEADESLPLKAPCLTAVDNEGTLFVGLTFDTRLAAFKTTRQSQEALMTEWIAGNQKDPYLHYHRALLFEQNAQYENALNACIEGAERLLAQNAQSASTTHCEVDLLLQLSRLALHAVGNKAEPALLKGFDILNRHLDLDRQRMLDSHKAWEIAAADYNQKLVEEQKRILEQREDHRTFNKELFDAETQDKKLYRQLREVFFAYRKTAGQWSEYCGNVINCKPGAPGLKLCLNNVENHLTRISEITLRLLDDKEKNEAFMVRSFGEMQDQQDKWGAFLIRSNTNLRIIDVLRQVHFEIRSLLANLKGIALQYPEDSDVEKTLRRQIIDPPHAETILKILSGYQEEWTFHKSLEILLKDIVDTWISRSQPPRPCAVTLADFGPVAFDAEELNLREIAQSQLIEAMPLKKTAAGLVCGTGLYPPENIPADTRPLLETLQETLQNQRIYETQYQEVRRQLEDLAQQKQQLETKLNEVNPQDKKAPVTLQNNIAVVSFQVSILGRMLLTMEINETNNLCRLVAGTALLMAAENQETASGAADLLQSIHAFQSEQEEKIQQSLEDRKHLSFEISRLNATLADTSESQRVEELNQSLEIKGQVAQKQLLLEKREHSLNRYFRIRNLVDKLRQVKQQDPSRAHDPQWTFHLSFGNGGPRTEPLLQPHGVTATRKGDLVFADYEGHRVFRFSSRGIYKNHFGGWGNAPGNFKYPVYVQEDSREFLYVVDEKNRRVQKLTAEGNFVLSFGDHESPEQRLGSVFSLSIDSADRIWVPDSAHNRIQIYDANGALMRTVQNETLREPVSVCCLENGEYLIGDRSEFLLKHFGPDGKLIRQLKRNEMACGEIYFLAHDPEHGIFATDYWNNQILHLTPGLEVVSLIRNGGRRAGQSGKVGGLAVHKNQLFVADFENYRIQAFDLAKTPPGKN